MKASQMVERMRPFLAMILRELEMAEEDDGDRLAADRWRQDAYRVLVRYNGHLGLGGMAYDPSQRLFALALRRSGKNEPLRWNGHSF